MIGRMIGMALGAMMAALPGLAQSPGDLPAGTYRLDPAHTTLTFAVDHLGLSMFRAGFDRVTGTLVLDPADPAGAVVSVEIDAASLDLPDPGNGFYDTMMSETFLSAAAHPVITFESDAVTLTGETAAEVAGALTIRGETRPVVLRAEVGTGYAPGILEPNGRIGFSAETEILRSEFGMTFGIPAPGTVLGVGDSVAIRIEAEFVGPD